MSRENLYKISRANVLRTAALSAAALVLAGCTNHADDDPVISGHSKVAIQDLQPAKPSKPINETVSDKQIAAMNKQAQVAAGKFYSGLLAGKKLCRLLDPVDMIQADGCSVSYDREGSLVAEHDDEKPYMQAFVEKVYQPDTVSGRGKQRPDALAMYVCQNVNRWTRLTIANPDVVIPEGNGIIRPNIMRAMAESHKTQMVSIEGGANQLTHQASLITSFNQSRHRLATRFNPGRLLTGNVDQNVPKLPEELSPYGLPELIATQQLDQTNRLLQIR